MTSKSTPSLGVDIRYFEVDEDSGRDGAAVLLAHSFVGGTKHG